MTAWFPGKILFVTIPVEKVNLKKCPSHLPTWLCLKMLEISDMTLKGKALKDSSQN